MTTHRRGRRLRAIHEGHRACFRGRTHDEDPFTKHCRVCGRPAESYVLGVPSPVEMVDAVKVMMAGERRRRSVQSIGFGRG